MCIAMHASSCAFIYGQRVRGREQKGDGKRRKRKIVTEVGPAVSGTAGFRFVSQKSVPVSHLLSRLNWGLSFVFKNSSGVHKLGIGYDPEEI